MISYKSWLMLRKCAIQYIDILRELAQGPFSKNDLGLLSSNARRAYVRSKAILEDHEFRNSATFEENCEIIRGSTIHAESCLKWIIRREEDEYCRIKSFKAFLFRKRCQDRAAFFKAFGEMLDKIDFSA